MHVDVACVRFCPVWNYGTDFYGIWYWSQRQSVLGEINFGSYRFVVADPSGRAV